MLHYQHAGLVDERGCSAAQRWLWALDQLIGPSPEYNVYQAVLLDGVVDLDRLQDAFTSLVHRHPVLRTVYHARDGQPVAVLLPVDRLAVPALSSPDLDSAVALAGELVAEPFELDRDLPVRMWLIRLADGSALLVLCLHHITTDAWSLEIIWRELAAGYDRAPLPTAAEPEPPAEPDPDELADQLEFWRQELAGLEPVELPTDRPRPARRSGRGAQLTVPLPAGLSERLTAFVRDRGSTLFPVLLAAVEVVLTRWTRTRDVAIGTVVSGRFTEASESVIGYLVNTVVVRDRLRPDDTAGTLLDRLRNQLLEVYCNSEVPFAEVVAAAGALHDPRRNPFFDVMVTLQDEATAAFSPAGLRVTPVMLPTVTSKFDLSLMFTTGPAGLSAHLAYATDQFDEATGHRLAQQVCTVLERICAEPDVRLRTLDILPPAESRLVLRYGNGAAAALDTRSIPEIFADRVRVTPDAPAVRCGATTLSYRELDEASGRLAHRLRRRIGAGDRVAVRLERTPRLLVALLAVLKAGGCYVPISVSAPAERSEEMVTDSGCAFVLTEHSYQELSEEQPGSEALLPPVTADHLAYVIYTSGSTGRPKGVQVSQSSVVNLSEDFAARLRLGPGGVVAAVASHSFDMSVPELITPLLCGAALRLVPREATLDAAALAAELADVTFAQLTPSHWQLLLDDGWSNRRLLAGCGAEAFPPALAVRLVGAVAELWNFYGPTETTVWSTAAEISDGASDHLPVPIGAPLRNTFALVLDDELNLAPIGVPGELYLGGAGVALGYHGAPALTAASFLPDPWHPGQRLYRTGDLARWRPEGQLEFQARVDQQVKLRGFRIELAEVEIALERHPDVVKAAVTVCEQAADRFLAGFLMLRPNAELDAIRSFVAGVLPYYMVPAVLQQITRIPMSGNGKTDRRQLPTEGLQRPAAGGSPRTDAERAVAAAFGSVLQVAGVGRDDDFFALGGHSLGAAEVVSRLREQLRRPISVQTLFQHPSVQAFAAAVDLRGGLEQPPTIEQPLAIEPATTQQPSTAEASSAASDRSAAAVVPLSSQQQRLWLLDRLSPGRVDYNVQRVLRLRGPLDRQQLARALASVGHRHELLRTRFPAEHARPAAVIDVPVPELRYTELPEQAPAAALAAATGLAQADIDSPLDLAAGPLWRARLIRLAADDHVLVLVFHHIIIDGGSFAVFFRDLSRAYLGQRLPPAKPYSEYSRRQQAAVDAEVLRYWRDRLAGPAGAELPTDRPRPVERTGSGAELRFEAGAELTGRLHDLARSVGVTFFGVGLAAFAMVLARFSRSREVIVGTPVSGRDAGTEDVLGCFVNTLALRVNCSPDSTVRQLLRQVRTVIAEGYANQSMPFERLVEESQPGRDLSRNPIFQIMFAVPAVETVELAGLRVEPVETTATTSKFDLSIEFAPTGAGSIVYDTQLFDRQSVEDVLEAFRALLTDLPTALDVPVRELVTVHAPPATAPPAAAGLPDRVLAAIRRAPAAVAARQGSAELTYAELSRRSARLATWLRRQGIGRGDLVGVQLPAGFDLVAAMLGISRTGAAFVPLDPRHPAQRRTQLIDQVGAKLVLDGWPAAADAGEPAPVADARLTAADLLGVYFTSGSSGPPKAVRETHGGVASYFGYLEQVIGLRSDDVVLQLAASTFDASLRDLFGPLAVGGCTVLLEPEQRRNPYRVVQAIHEHAVTALLAVVPSVLAALVQASRGRTVNLRLILVSGEVLTAQQAAAVAAWAPGARLVNQYGPTECTMTSTWHEVTDADLRAGVVPVGRPIPGTAAHVVGLDGQLLPSGALGELWLGGAGLSQGYQSAAQTANRFVPSPAGSGERLYRTGDLVHRRHDGCLIYHGRIDSQLKVRGVRIEPAEIEQVLAGCPGVQAAAVALRGDVLVAYLVGRYDIARVRGILAAELPSAMHPDRIVEIPELPYKSNGKLDRSRLPDPTPDTREAGLAARDVAELTMASVWQQVLGLPAVGVQDDFFALGGNSLKAVEVVELLHREHRVELPMHLLFTHPTVERLCAALPDWEAADGQLVPLRNGDPAQPPLVLVHAQSGEVCSYLDLVRELRTTGPVFGIEAVGYNNDEPVLDRIEAMAARYLEELRAVAPAGPYRLAGWSFGGNVAFEMAHQLEQAGERVDFLGIIDARAFGKDDQESWYLDKPEAARFGLVAGLPATNADSLQELDENSLLEVLLAHAREQGAVSDRATSATMRRMLAVFSANGRAAEQYRTRAVISADIHLFRASERHPTLTNPVVDTAAWQARTTGRLRAHQVAGTHHDLLDRDHAPAFARQLEDALAAEEAES